MENSFTPTQAGILPHEKCLEFINLILDGEATEEEKKQVSLHLQGCVHCNEAYLLEKAIRNALKNRIQPQQLPLDLLSSIKAKIISPYTHP